MASRKKFTNSSYCFLIKYSDFKIVYWYDMNKFKTEWQNNNITALFVKIVYGENIELNYYV